MPVPRCNLLLQLYIAHDQAMKGIGAVMTKNHRHTRRWAIPATLTLLIWLSVIIYSKIRRYHEWLNPTVPSWGLNAEGDIHHIDEHLGLSPLFAYRRYCFTANSNSELNRSSLQHVRGNFMSDRGDTTYQDVLGYKGDLQECTKSTYIDTPDPRKWSPVDTSKLLLGMSTTLSRLQASLPAFSRWLSGTNTRLVVLLVDRPDLDSASEEIAFVQSQAEAMDMMIEMRPYHPPANDNTALRNFALSDLLREECRPGTEWIAIADDDTFFVSLPKLVEELSKYDSGLHWYLGGVTESLTQIKDIGWMALGGAGIILSRPLLEDVADHSDACRTLRQPKRGGDTLWRDCIMRTTYTKLTPLQGLNQVDLWRDVSGFYESGLEKLLTVHHWKSWHYAPIPMGSLVTDVAGPDAFLQRYQFQDNVVMTNGYSIVQYLDEVPDLQAVELTMMKGHGSTKKPGPMEYAHSLGPHRPALKEGSEKRSWKFEYAIKDKDETVSQYYINRGKDGTADDVIQIDWIQRRRNFSLD